jgi:DNA-binding IclR family transcriptional regulator
MSNGNQSLSRGLAILSELEAASEPLGIREIARRLGLNPATTQRLVNTLVEEAFLLQEPVNQKYTLGYKALSLGSSLLDDNRLVSSSMMVLPELSSRLEVNCFLGTMVGNHLVYVLALQSPGPISIKSATGSRVCLHSTAMGKAMLAERSDDEVRLLIGCEPLEKFTELTILSQSELLSELDKIRLQGFASAHGENLIGVDSVGVVVRGADGNAAGAISAAYAPSLQPLVQIAELIRRLSEAARQISQQLGCPEAELPENVTIRSIEPDVA